jgi:hypothetical protein
MILFDSMCDILVFLLLSVKIHKTNKTISTASIGLFHSFIDDEDVSKEMNKHIEFACPAEMEVFFSKTMNRIVSAMKGA